MEKELEVKINVLVDELDDLRADFAHWCRINNIEETDYLVEALDEVFGATISIKKKGRK